MPAVGDEEAFEQWMAAGRVAARALRVGVEACRPATPIVEIVEAVESFIRDQGMGLAFPCTVSLNDCAAHYTPDHNDGRVLEKGDLAKVDCGAELRGALSDNARSVDVGATGRHTRIIAAAEACLTEAESVIGPNANLGTVGGVIAEVARRHGFKPIQNLTGHSLDWYDLHAGITVPNVQMRLTRRPRIGDVLACEPFVTDGEKGRVENSGPGNIYHLQAVRPQRLPSSKKLLAAIQTRHPKLPFAQRWLADVIDTKKLAFTLAHLQKAALIKHYPALSEASGGMVAQAEHTLIVTAEGCVVSTDPDSKY